MNDLEYIKEFLEKLNSNNSSNYKLSVLTEYSNSELIKLYLKLTYDKISFTYGLKKIPEIDNSIKAREISMKEIEQLLSKLNQRIFTGNNAIKHTQELLSSIKPELRFVFTNILDRDIHSGVSTKQINKVFKNLIPEFPYMRCSLQDKLKEIEYPAYLQVKADGTYRTFIKYSEDEIKAFSRDGKEYFHPKIFELLKDKNFKNGAYIGELICKNIEGSNSTDIRYKSNGLLNSLTPPEDVIFYTWDFLTLEEFQNQKSSINYKERFRKILEMCSSYCDIKPIKTFTVESLEKAKEITEILIKEGEEGTILKNHKMLFKNGTSKEQIKLKQEQTIEVRCTGFTEGNGKFKETFGAITFVTDDNQVNGQVSGLKDDERKEIWDNKEKYINKIFTVKATDLVKSKDSNEYSLMHPRFVEFRNDKDFTDDFERIQNMFN